MRKIHLFILAAILISCNSENEAPSSYLDIDEYELQEIFTVQENDDFFLGRPFLATSDGRGNVYVGDVSTNEIFVFDMQGHKITTIGREGDGPGEFKGLGRINFGENMELYVYDNRVRRVSRFDYINGSYEFQSSFLVQSTDGYFPMQVGYLSNGIFLVYYTKFMMGGDDLSAPRDAIYLIDSDGNIQPGPLMNVRNMEMIYIESGETRLNVMKPFGNWTISLPSSDGTFLEIWTAEAKINRYNSAGEIINTFGLDIPASAVTDEDRERMANSQSSIASQMLNNMPDVKAVVNEAFVAGNGDVWLWIGQREDHTWLVFDYDGNPIKRLSVPAGVRLTDADDIAVYGTNLDEASVHSYSLIKK